MSDSRVMPITEALQINPQVSLARGQEYSFVEMADLVEHVTRVRSNKRKEFKGSGARFQDQDTLFARITPCLENGKIAKFYGAGEVGFGSTEFIVFRGRDGLTTTDYAHYVATSPDFRNFAISKMTGSSGRQRVPVDALEHYEICVPSLDVQRTIGKILGDLDDKIDLLRKMNRTLEEIARAIFHAWFVDFEPVRAKAAGATSFRGMPQTLFDQLPDSFTLSDLGDIPTGWNVKPLTEIAELNPESWTKSTYPPFVQYVDLSNTKWGIIDEVISYEKEKAPSRAQRILRAGDTIVGTVRPGNGSFSFISGDGLTGSTGFAVLRPKQDIYRELLYLAATSPTNIRRLAHVADGGAYPAVRPIVVAETEFFMANSQAIKGFSSLTRPQFDQIETNKSKIATLAALRDTLLPKLISLELPTPDLEAVGLTPTESMEASDG